jgi:hypothetical protein
MIKIHSDIVKNRACLLRNKGLSLREISLELGIPKNTIQGWVRHINLNDEQIERLKQKEILGGYIGRKNAKAVLKKKIENWKNQIRKKVAYLENAPCKNNDISKIICGLMYICEGGKYPLTRQLTFGNSDPKIIKLFLKLLRKCFYTDESKFRCRIMHRCDQDGEELNKFWSITTGIPLKQFYKSYADKRTEGKPTKKNSYRGVCALMYFDTALQFELQAIGEIVLKFGGADGD